MGKEFGEEMKDFGERFGKHMEHKGKEFGKRWDNWWFRTFGFVAPIIGSIFGIIFLALGILILNFINLYLGSYFVFMISNFLLANLHIFFVFSLIFGYGDYFSKRYPETYWVVLPIINSIGAVFVAWIAIFILDLINSYVASTFIANVSNFLYTNLVGIFIVFLVLGYVFVIIKRMIMSATRF